MASPLADSLSSMHLLGWSDRALVITKSYAAGVARIRMAMQRCLANNQGDLLFVTGERGAGKTQFLRWIAGTLANDDRAIHVDVNLDSQMAGFEQHPEAVPSALQEAIVTAFFQTKEAQGSASFSPVETDRATIVERILALPSWAGRPVIVTVDNLDKSTRLLEAIQSFFALNQGFLERLLSKRPVLFVFAALPAWLETLAQRGRGAEFLPTGNRIHIAACETSELKQILERRLEMHNLSAAATSSFYDAIRAASGGLPREAIRCFQQVLAMWETRTNEPLDTRFAFGALKQPLESVMGEFVTDSVSRVPRDGYKDLFALQRSHPDRFRPTLELLTRCSTPVPLTAAEEIVAQTIGPAFINRTEGGWKTQLSITNFLGEWKKRFGSPAPLADYFDYLEPAIPAPHFRCARHHSSLRASFDGFKLTCRDRGHGATCGLPVALPSRVIVFDTSALYDGLPDRMLKSGLLKDTMIVVPRVVLDEVETRKEWHTRKIREERRGGQSDSEYSPDSNVATATLGLASLREASEQRQLSFRIREDPANQRNRNDRAIEAVAREFGALLVARDDLMDTQAAPLLAGDHGAAHPQSGIPTILYPKSLRPKEVRGESATTQSAKLAAKAAPAAAVGSQVTSQGGRASEGPAAAANAQPVQMRDATCTACRKPIQVPATFLGSQPCCRACRANQPK